MLRESTVLDFNAQSRNPYGNDDVEL